MNDAPSNNDAKANIVDADTSLWPYLIALIRLSIVS
jgi:hypothetical protein